MESEWNLNGITSLFEKTSQLETYFSDFCQILSKRTVIYFNSAISKEKRGKANPSSPRTKSFFDYKHNVLYHRFADSLSDIIDTFEVERINCYGYTLGTSKAITPRPYKRIGFAFGVFATVWDSQLIIPFNVTIPKDSTSITVSSLTLTTSSSSLVTSGTYDFTLFTFRLS